MKVVALFPSLIGSWLQGAKVVALFPGLLSLLLAALPGLQLTLPGVALSSACLAFLYWGISGQLIFLRKPPLWLVPFINGNQIPSYAVALTATVLLLYAFRSRAGLWSDRALAQRPGSAFLCGLFTFALTTFTALWVAVLLQWALDHIWQRQDDLFTAPLGAYAICLLGLSLVLPRWKRLEPKHRWAAYLGCVLSFPAVFGHFFWLQFAWKWTW